MRLAFEPPLFPRARKGPPSAMPAGALSLVVEQRYIDWNVISAELNVLYEILSVEREREFPQVIGYQRP
jgi:hypothetical protein